MWSLISLPLLSSEVNFDWLNLKMVIPTHQSPVPGTKKKKIKGQRSPFLTLSDQTQCFILKMKTNSPKAFETLIMYNK
jgi:hypothetical protein